MPYFITTNIEERFWFFDNEKYAQLLYQIIIEAGRIKGFNLYAFCILPDHLHLLVKNGGRALEKARCGTEGETFFCFASHGFYPYIRRESSSLPQRGLFPEKQRGLSSPRGYTISDLMQSIKGNFSRQIHVAELWQSRYNFRIIDNEKRLYNILQYIKYNYEKHGLPGKYSRYPHLYLNNELINELFF
ncbi:MAG: transposase [Patescibacteria group bacterium]